jgi:hypothetical protein
VGKFKRSSSSMSMKIKRMMCLKEFKEEFHRQVPGWSSSSCKCNPNIPIKLKMADLLGFGN